MIAMLARVSFWIWVPVVFLASSCTVFSLWRGTDEFVGRLRCGMTRVEVATVAARYSGLNLRDDASWPPWNLIATKDDTTISLEVGPSGLRRYQVSWVDAIMHVANRPVQNLCADR